MIEPPMPSKGMNVLDWSMKVWRYLRASTPRVGPGLQSRETPSGTIISLAPRAAAAVEKILPFEISTRGSGEDLELVIAPGTIHLSAKDEFVETGPADGTWYAEAKVTINTSTGAITATALQWVQEESVDSETVFHLTLGTLEVTDGAPGEITQYNYGPVLAHIVGGTTTAWTAYLV